MRLEALGATGGGGGGGWAALARKTVTTRGFVKAPAQRESAGGAQRLW